MLNGTTNISGVQHDHLLKQKPVIQSDQTSVMGTMLMYAGKTVIA